MTAPQPFALRPPPVRPIRVPEKDAHRGEEQREWHRLCGAPCPAPSCRKFSPGRKRSAGQKHFKLVANWLKLCHAQRRRL